MKESEIIPSVPKSNPNSFDPSRSAPYVNKFVPVPIVRGKEEQILYIPVSDLTDDSQESIRAEAQHSIRLYEWAELMMDIPRYLSEMEGRREETLATIIDMAAKITAQQMLVLYFERAVTEETSEGITITVDVDEPPDDPEEQDKLFYNTMFDKAVKKLEPILSSTLRKFADEIVLGFWHNMAFLTALNIEKELGDEGLKQATIEQVNEFWARDFSDSYEETLFMAAQTHSRTLLEVMEPAGWSIDKLRGFFDTTLIECNGSADVLLDSCSLVSQAKTQAPKKRNSLKPLSSSGQLRWPSDRINKAAVEALMPGAIIKVERMGDTLDKFDARGLNLRVAMWAAYLFESKKGDLYGAIGFTQNPGEAIWGMLQKNGALAVKAQFALWARAYLETDARPNEYIEISINQFCDDLGLPRKKRAHTRENKQRAVDVLRAITQLELSAEWQSPKGKALRLRGPLWQRGAEAEERDTYGDLFGQKRIGDPSGWEPVGFAYAPGYFFSNQEWRKYNRNVALIGQGILKLGSGNNDKYAVMVGGYIATCSRMNKYHQSAFRVETLLMKSGLIEIYGNEHPGKMRDMLERSLERIKEVGVIKDWQLAEAKDEFNPDDFDNPEVLVNLAEPCRWSKRWREQCILIRWPDTVEQRGEKLQARKAAHIAKRRTRKQIGKSAEESA